MKQQPMRGRTCWLCGKNGAADPLDKHHIFEGTNRWLSEKYGLWVPLCHTMCHEYGPGAVHRNAQTARRLKEYGQRLAMEENGWTADEFRGIFGRNYLDGEPEPEEAGWFMVEEGLA